MKKSHKNIWLSMLAVGIIFGGIVVANESTSKDPAMVAALEILQSKKVTVHKTPTCGCCGNFVTYLRRQGIDVEVVEAEDLTPLKQQYNVPLDKQSCHTTIIGDGEYVVEGHVPLEGIQKMLATNGTVTNIGIANMPSGSPGMPGPKRAPFDVYSFTRDGAVSDFIAL